MHSTKSLTEDLRAAKSLSMRLQILNVASQMLTEHGPQELSMRKLAQALGMSTIVLYTYFQDKQDILDQLYQEGFTRLKQDLLAVSSQQEAMAYVMELGRAYRRSAVANSTYYQIMFTRCVPGFNPSASSRESSRQAFAILVAGVQRCIDEKVIQISGAANANNIAQVLWGTLHGVISLELFGYLGGAVAGEALLEQAIQTIRAGFLTPHPKHEL
jgi:AcrR family transcriptional regulator